MGPKGGHRRRRAQAGRALPSCTGHTCTATATVMKRELPVWCFSSQTPPSPSIRPLLWRQKETVGLSWKLKRPGL